MTTHPQGVYPCHDVTAAPGEFANNGHAHDVPVIYLRMVWSGYPVDAAASFSVPFPRQCDQFQCRPLPARRGLYCRGTGVCHADRSPGVRGRSESR
jgi:hypothetical protein